MNLLKEWGERLDDIGPVAKRVGDKADGYACAVIELLREIRNATQNLYRADVYEYPRMVFEAAGVRLVEGRSGYAKIVRQIAISTPGAATVNLFIGEATDGGFMTQVSQGGAGREALEVFIPIPEGQPIIIDATAPASVNLIVERIKL